MQFQSLKSPPTAVGRSLQQPRVGARCACSALKPSHRATPHHSSSCCSSPHSHEVDSSRLSPSYFLPGVAAAICALGTAASSAAAEAAAAAATAAEAVTPVDPSTYVPGPVEVGWQIWFAAVVSTVPFVIGAYEFGKRILIQRRCKVCNGSGLVSRGKGQRKCPQCGGFFPWVSWRMFLSANARPGNGGPLLQPRGQTSVFYTVPPPQPADASPPPTVTATGKVQEGSSEQTTAAGDK